MTARSSCCPFGPIGKGLKSEAIAAIHRVGLSGNPGGRFGAQEQSHTRYIFRLTQSPNYVTRSNGLCLLAGDEFCLLDLAKRRLERGQGNRIAGDAESTRLARESAYKPCSTCLCG